MNYVDKKTPSHESAYQRKKRERNQGIREEFPFVDIPSPYAPRKAIDPRRVVGSVVIVKHFRNHAFLEVAQTRYYLSLKHMRADDAARVVVGAQVEFTPRERHYGQKYPDAQRPIIVYSPHGE